MNIWDRIHPIIRDIQNILLKANSPKKITLQADSDKVEIRESLKVGDKNEKSISCNQTSYNREDPKAEEFEPIDGRAATIDDSQQVDKLINELNKTLESVQKENDQFKKNIKSLTTEIKSKAQRIKELEAFKVANEELKLINQKLESEQKQVSERLRKTRNQAIDSLINILDTVYRFTNHEDEPMPECKRFPYTMRQIEKALNDLECEVINDKDARFDNSRHAAEKNIVTDDESLHMKIATTLELGIVASGTLIRPQSAIFYLYKSKS